MNNLIRLKKFNNGIQTIRILNLQKPRNNKIALNHKYRMLIFKRILCRKKFLTLVKTLIMITTIKKVIAITILIMNLSCPQNQRRIILIKMIYNRKIVQKKLKNKIKVLLFQSKSKKKISISIRKIKILIYNNQYKVKIYGKISIKIKIKYNNKWE